MNTLVILLLILIIIVIMGMMLAMSASKKAEEKKRALNVIRGSNHVKDDKGKKGNAQDKRREEIAKKLKDSTDDDEDKKKVTIKLKLRQAGLKITVKQFWMFSLAFGVVLAIIIKLIGQSPFIVVMAFITGFLGIPRFILNGKIKKRQKKFLEEFGDALEAMVRLLKAGMPVTEAIRMCGREFEGPVGEEMLMIYDAQKIGIPLPEATLEAAERMPITEMQMFATGIAIQTQTGASLSEVLTNLAGVIRARFRLKRKVQALSAEAKASAMIIGSLPFLIGLGLYFINREYIMLLFDTSIGNAMLIGGAVWMSIGIMIMKIMINFKV